MTDLIIFMSIGYLAGSVPFGLLCGYMAGIGDIRGIGSGNIGATNVLRSGNKLAAFGTLVGDAGKGALVVWATGFAGYEAAMPAVGLAAVIGHCYPIWLHFKGGKGVATAIATIAVLHWPSGLTMALTWLIMSALFRISSLSALTAFATASIAAFLLYNDWGFILAIALLSFWRHKENISRLLSGTESRISLTKKS
ncbi:MAG: glycerol-3-phosphate 1-O-acyltransferase PlsY [Candidatus Puniceispirillaceae bacterium]